MSNDSPFVDLNESQDLVPVLFKGVEYRLPAGMNLAAALLASGLMSFRKTPVSGTPRGPYCMMGTCYDCLVRINGVTQQACMIAVTQGLKIDGLKPSNKPDHD